MNISEMGAMKDALQKYMPEHQVWGPETAHNRQGLMLRLHDAHEDIRVNGIAIITHMIMRDFFY